MPEDSPYDLLVEAFRDAKQQMVDAARELQSDMIRPLDPRATKLTRAQRREEFSKFMLDSAHRESEFLRLQQRFQLPEDKPIPRRLVQYIIQGQREAE